MGSCSGTAGAGSSSRREHTDLVMALQNFNASGLSSKSQEIILLDIEHQKEGETYSVMEKNGTKRLAILRGWAADPCG